MNTYVDVALESEVEELRKKLKEERDRADRAVIGSHIAWEAVALMRELITKYQMNITMMRDYEPIREMEGWKYEKEIERRFEKKREKERLEMVDESGNGDGRKGFDFPPHGKPETLEEQVMINEDGHD